jgi:Flp pilus assembly protein TadD
MIQFQDQNYEQAANHLARAAELGLNDPALYNFLGISYSRTNRLQKAVSSYKQALALEASRADVHLNLGFAYQRLGRASEAKKEYAEACRLDSKLCDLKPQ